MRLWWSIGVSLAVGLGLVLLAVARLSRTPGPVAPGLPVETPRGPRVPAGWGETSPVDFGTAASPRSAERKTRPAEAGPPPTFPSGPVELRGSAPSAPFAPPQAPVSPPPKPPPVVIPLEPVPHGAESSPEGQMAKIFGGGLLHDAPPGPAPPGGSPPGSTLSLSPVEAPPRFRDVGVAIGEAMEITATGQVTFPLSLSLTYDPREPQAKGVTPELIQVFYFNQSTGRWSTEGLRMTRLDVSAGLVAFEAAHLTVFRLGVPRGRPPLIHQVRPAELSPVGQFVVLGQGFSPTASQNVLTLGGSYVLLALGLSGSPQRLDLADGGETLVLQAADGGELDRAELTAAPGDRSSWTRDHDGDRQSPFVAHTAAHSGRLFSPGVRSDGEPFAFVQGTPASTPRPGDLVINEVLLSPPVSFLGDANGDGETNAREDEFIELVNTSGVPLRLDDCRLLTRSGERHRFRPGTLLPGGMAMVVFGVDDALSPPQPAGPFGGVRFFPDSSGTGRLVSRLPQDATPGPNFLTMTTLRQTSNPAQVQILTPVQDRQPGFQEASSQVPAMDDRALRLIRAGDVDRDLDVDLVAVGGQSGVVVLLNDGLGRFSEAPEPVVLPAGHAVLFDLALVDVTEDGAPDLLVGDTDEAGSYTQLFVLENGGGGDFAFLSNAGVLNTAASSGPTALAAGDLDGDGGLEVVVAMIGDQALVFRNDGGGHFSHAPGADVLPQAGAVVPTDVELADVDGDGDLDVLLSAGLEGLGSSAALQLFINDGTGRFTQATDQQLPHDGAGIDDLAVGNLDRDEDLDVVAGSRTAPVRIVRNGGAGTFTFEDAGLAEEERPTSLLLADLEGDGDADLVLSHAPQDRAYRNAGDGSLSPLPAMPQRAGDHRELVALDVDGDGDLDLAGVGPGLSLQLNTVTRINHPPRITPIGEQVVMEGATLAFDVGAEDADGDRVALTMTLASGEPLTGIGAAFTDLGDGRGTFRWTPGDDQGALGGRRYELLVRGTDGITVSEERVSILVKDFNRPPTMESMPAVTVDESAPLMIDVGQRTHDPDPGDVLAFSGIGLPAGSALDGATGVFRWTPDDHAGDGPDGSRSYSLTFMATDLAGASAQQVVTVTVRHVNHAPVFRAPVLAQTVSEGEELVLVVVAEDPDGDPASVTAAELPQGATFDAATRTFRWRPTFLQGRVAPYPARFEASDGRLNTILELSITVVDVNRPPAFVGLMDQTVEEGHLLVLDLVVQDPDGDPVRVQALDLPAGALFVPEALRLTWTPTAAQAGAHDVTFEATDGVATVRATIRIVVGHVNHPPLLGTVGEQTVLEGQLLQFAINVSDVDGDPLTVTASPLPRGARLFRQGDVYLFQWVPGADQSGSYPLTIEVTDGLIPTPVSGELTVTVRNNPGFQRLTALVGITEHDLAPLATSVGAIGDLTKVTLEPGASLVLDLGDVHPALVSTLELFHTAPALTLVESDLQLFVSDDNIRYQAYEGPSVFSAEGNRATLSHLNIAQRYIKIYRQASSSPQQTALANFLPDIVRASGAIPLDALTEAAIEALAHRTFLYFAEQVNANGLISDRVAVNGEQVVSGTVYSTAATGFWLATLPIAAQRGWLTREQAEAFATRTLQFYLGTNDGPVQGQFGFYYHFLNADGTRFTDFGDDGVSILDSTMLWLGGIACGEYFGGAVKSLATELYDRADWNAFFDHDVNMLRLLWTPEHGFVRHLDYTSEGLLAYLLAAGASAHPVQPDADLPQGADGYYTYSRGNFGRVLGRFGRDGRPLLQSFFGSLFTYLYPTLFVDLGGVRDAFNIDWEENAREAVLANFRFAQVHPEAGYGRLYWGISASDGPEGYQGLYGTPPLDPGAFGERYDGTVAPYALAGSLPLAADLALPALQHVTALQSGRLFGRYGLRSGINVLKDFFDSEYLGLDQGALGLGLEEYRTGQIGELVRRSDVLQRAFQALGFRTTPALPLQGSGPRSQHAYIQVNTTDGLVQTVQVDRPTSSLSGDLLFELHPDSIDTAHGDRFVDADVTVNGLRIGAARFLDRRSNGTVDVGSVYLPIQRSLLFERVNAIGLTWAGGERWLQLEDVELGGPTGRLGTQETWQIGQRDRDYAEFWDERLVNDSYLVGDEPKTLERALNVVDEPTTDVLFELADVGVDRVLRLVAAQTQDDRAVTVEVSVNEAVVGQVTLRSREEASVDISRTLLRGGWNHVRLRHANMPGDGQFILWDAMTFDFQADLGAFQVTVRAVQGDQAAPGLQFGVAPAAGAVLPSQHYLEIQYEVDPTFDRITIATDNRHSPLHRFTGPPDAGAAGLVGLVDPAVTVPLLWQVYDARRTSAPAFTNTTEWAFVPDLSDPNISTPETLAYRTLVSTAGLGDRPKSGRSASPPVAVYLVADFRGKPAQGYATDRLVIELFSK